MREVLLLIADLLSIEANLPTRPSKEILNLYEGKDITHHTPGHGNQQLSGDLVVDGMVLKWYLGQVPTYEK